MSELKNTDPLHLLIEICEYSNEVLLGRINPELSNKEYNEECDRLDGKVEIRGHIRINGEQFHSRKLCEPSNRSKTTVDVLNDLHTAAIERLSDPRQIISVGSREHRSPAMLEKVHRI